MFNVFQPIDDSIDTVTASRVKPLNHRRQNICEPVAHGIIPLYLLWRNWGRVAVIDGMHRTGAFIVLA